MSYPQESESQSESRYLPSSLTITPIRGYRTWVLNTDIFASAWDKGIWPYGEPRKAECKNGCTLIPCDHHCYYDGVGRCGLYASHRPEYVRPPWVAGMYRKMTGQLAPFWGVVETEGRARVVKHKLGFRASNLRIKAVCDTGRSAQLVAGYYGVPCLSATDIEKEFPPQVQYSLKELIG
jgi:hypothetical protein